MTRKTIWLSALGLIVALLAGLAIAVALLIPSNDELARMAEEHASAVFGVPVRIEALRWQLRPEPTIVMTGVATDHPQPITARQITAYLHWRPLLHHEIALDAVEVAGAVLPRASLHALAGRGEGPQIASAADFHLAPVPLEHFRFTDLVWISRTGVRVAYDGEVDFQERWRPGEIHLRRPGAPTETSLAATRVGQQDLWKVHLVLGKGTADGEVRVASAAGGRLHLSGELRTGGVEIASIVTAFNRRPAIAGVAVGTMVLSSDGANAAELSRDLHTQFPFTMAPATALRFDLDRAMQTFGKEHAGQTQLESLTGVMDTQNTPDGTVWSFTQLKAKSGSLTGSGDVVLFNRRINARGAIDLVNGLVGVPFAVTGSLDKPEISAPKGSIVGAVIGTVILPFIGTAIGARLGAMFGGTPSTPLATPTVAAAPKSAAQKSAPAKTPAKPVPGSE